MVLLYYRWNNNANFRSKSFLIKSNFYLLSRNPIVSHSFEWPPHKNIAIKDVWIFIFYLFYENWETLFEFHNNVIFFTRVHGMWLKDFFYFNGEAFFYFGLGHFFFPYKNSYIFVFTFFTTRRLFNPRRPEQMLRLLLSASAITVFFHYHFFLKLSKFLAKSCT